MANRQDQLDSTFSLHSDRTQAASHHHRHSPQLETSQLSPEYDLHPFDRNGYDFLIVSNKTLSVPSISHQHQHHNHRQQQQNSNRVDKLKSVVSIDSQNSAVKCPTFVKMNNLSHRILIQNNLSPLRMLFALVTVFCLAVSLVKADVRCPHVNLIHRLTAPNGAPVNRYAQALNHTPECDCTTIEEGGWEITCYANDEDSKMSAKPPPQLDFDSPDYNIDYNVLQTSFIVRYEIGRQLKLMCDKGAPAFKPALFQGFGIESIDTFVINKCDLPLTLPLSVVLYRTQPIRALSLSHKFGDANYNINTTGHADLVAPIRALYIKSHKSMGIQQLNTLLSDLESLEQLTLIDFELNDIDHFIVENMDEHMPAVFEHGTRIRRGVDNSSEEIATTTVINDLPDTTMPIEANNETETTTAIVMEELLTEAPVLNSNETLLENENLTSANLSMITEVSNPKVDSDLSEANIMNNTFEENDLGFDEDNINNVNVENKPIFTLDENALSFVRILPNLRVLRLRDFVKESNIPNVLFQIISGLDKLEYLELSSNNLNQIPKNALSFAGQSLKKLYLYKNSINEIHEDAFTNMTQLEILDLSHNKLTEIKDYTLKPLKNLLHLALKNNQFQSLSEYLLQANTKLMSLDLSQNRQLEPLSANILKGLNNLANFSLAYCNMPVVSTQLKQLFRNVPNLSKLDLKGNQIKNLTLNGLLAWNSKLNKLDFSSNQISEISKTIFSVNSSQITEIRLDKNRIAELPENIFNNVRNIRKLSLASNKLTEISPLTFIQLRLLEELDLSKNQIQTLNTHLNQLPFGIGGLLRKVNLSFNNLTNFETEIFDINWRLYVSISELGLSNNNFSGILRVPIFISSREPIISLDLSSNYFKSVQVDNIIDYVSLEDETHSHEARSWETLVRLDNNPIVCDCFLFPFLNYTKNSGRFFDKNYYHSILRKTLFILDSTNQLTCHQPSMLKDRSISNLKLDELICQIEDRRICPRGCHCTYRSIDQSAIINCDNSGFDQLPEQLNLARYYNISLKDTSTKIKNVENVIMKFRNNSISSIDGLSSMLYSPNRNQSKPMFVEIYMDSNNITAFENNLIPDQLQATNAYPLIRTLSLKNNGIKSVPISVLGNFDSHATALGFDDNQTSTNKLLDKFNKPIQAKLLLSENPIDCYNEPMLPGSECYIRDLKLWLSSHQNRVGDLNLIQCDEQSLDMERVKESNSSQTLVKISDDILCPLLIPPPNNAALIVLSIVCIVLASSLFVVSILYYRNKQTILAFIYIHLNPIFICLRFREEDLDEDKVYDAFVSYSSSDRDVVMDLIEKLEKPQDMNEVSLILQNGSSFHEGKIDQIVPENEFKKSATLKHKECDVENGDNGEDQYRLCIHERDWLPGNLISWNIVNSVQNSKRTILILSQSFIQSIWFQVEFHTAYYQMLEDKMDRLIVIVRGELPPKEQMDKDLNFLLTTKTYLVWGEKWFWEKLYYAMPHKKKQKVISPKDKYCNNKMAPNMTNGKSNGSTMNGALNSTNYKDGMLKWSSTYNNGHKNGKAEAMKEYVDQTIASHFQLNTLSPQSLNAAIQKQPQQYQTMSPATDNDNEPTKRTPSHTKPAPKSLRNSGSINNVSSAALQEFHFNNGGYENKSFINETNT